MRTYAVDSLKNSRMENTDYSAVRGIIFDYGGTIDSRGCHWSEVIWEAYMASGINVDKEAFREAYVHAERELARVRHILPHHNFLDLLRIKMRIELEYLAAKGLLDAGTIDEAVEATSRRCYEAAAACVEEARPVLEYLHARYPMVLVSNFYGNVEAVLEDFGLRKYFQSIVESAVVGVRKPDPRIFSLGCEALGIPSSEVLVIGDSLRKDIEPAESIGCKVMWIKGKGWTEAEDAQTHPCVIRSLKDIPDLLR